MSNSSHGEDKKGADDVEIKDAVHMIPSRSLEHHIVKEEKELDVAATVSTQTTLHQIPESA